MENLLKITISLAQSHKEISQKDFEKTYKLFSIPTRDYEI